jgi:hypothetical protein
MSQGLSWESVSWRSGTDQYRFEVERGGLFGQLSAPGGRSLNLPMVVWEGLLDALKANRSTRQRSQQQQFPSRSRARWYDGEIAEVADAYKSGRTIAELAQSHNRSAYAIEHQLDKLGLISTANTYGPDRDAGMRGPMFDGPSFEAMAFQIGEPCEAEPPVPERDERHTSGNIAVSSGG